MEIFVKFLGAWSLLGMMLYVPHAGAQTVTYLHTDPLGSVVAKSDVGGNIVERLHYAPYGEIAEADVQDGPGYAGHVSDASTGLSYMQQRYMAPELSVFLSVDPVTAYSNPIGAFNRYRYANNNPYTFTDPDGRDVQVASAAIPRVSGWIGKNAAGSFSISPQGALTMNSNTGGEGERSTYFRDKLAGVIDSSATMHVQVLSVYVDPVTFVPVDVDSQAGGGLTRALPNGDVDVVVSGNANDSLTTTSGGPLIDGPAEIFAHEVVAHAAPIMIGSDTGNGVQNENKFRMEVPGLDQRAPDPNHREF